MSALTVGVNRECLGGLLPISGLAVSDLAASSRLPSATREELLRLSGSSWGARPKIVAQVSGDKKSIIHGEQELAPGYSHWMIKFPSSQDAKDIGAQELLGTRTSASHSTFPLRHSTRTSGRVVQSMQPKFQLHPLRIRKDQACLPSHVQPPGRRQSVPSRTRSAHDEIFVALCLMLLRDTIVDLFLVTAEGQPEEDQALSFRCTHDGR